MTTVSQDLATLVSAFDITKVNETTCSVVDDLLLDTIGCSIGAFASPPIKSLRRTFEGSGGRREATILGTSRVAAVENAALINAAMARYLDYNDCYMSAAAACHPSDHIMALLSVAEAQGATGRDLVEAIVIAYEVEGLGLDACAVRPNGFDYVAWGVYSSVAAVGSLMDLTREEMTNAFGIAGASNNPLYVTRQGDISMWKGVAHAYATHNAIQACRMAQQGMTGPTEVFEGPFGFFDVVTKSEMSFAAGFEYERLRVLETSIKSFACGYYIHSPVAGTLQLIDSNDIDPGEINAINIEMFDHAVDALATPEKWAKDLTRETADHSIPYTVAVAALDGEVTPAQYAPNRLDAADVHDMMARVDVESSQSLTDHRNEHPRHIPSITTIRVDDQVFQTRVDCPLGHPENPMSRGQVEAKFRDNCERYLSEEQQRQCIDLCADVVALEEVGALTDAVVI